jgi:hypothetical protein
VTKERKGADMEEEQGKASKNNELLPKIVSLFYSSTRQKPLFFWKPPPNI